MKKLLGLALAIGIAVILAGCSNDTSIIKPIVGAWGTQNLIGSATAVINRDGTCVETYTLFGSVGVTKSGTWSTTKTVLTRVWDSSTETSTYTLSDSNKELTLASGGVSALYTRK